MARNNAELSRTFYSLATDVEQVAENLKPDCAVCAFAGKGQI